MKIQKIDHIGVIVNDLASAKEFFLDFGLELLWEGEVDGKWAERIIELNGSVATVVMLGMPDGQAALELVKFHGLSDTKAIQQSAANHIAFAVEDIESIVANLKMKGAELLGEIQNYENAYKLCFVRGPEGIVLELAEKIQS